MLIGISVSCFVVNMFGLSKREKEVLETALTSADDKVVAGYLHITPEQVRVHKTRVRRKVKVAQSFLRRMKKYRRVLNPEKKYKGIS